MATYSVEPISSNLHGNFSRDHEPILTIDSGDTVVFRTLEASWQIKDRTSLEDPPEYIQGVPEEKRSGDGQ
jgi:acetamidase/formamidase